MVRYFIRAVAFAALAQCAAVTCAYAGELRILDSHGLVRATEDVKHESTVVITLTAPVKERALQLSNVNGLAPDITGTIEATTVRFSPVPEGVWRIVAPQASIAIAKVEIH